MLKLIYYFDMRNLAVLGVLCLLFLSCSHQDEESVPEDLTQEFVVENGTLVKYHPQGDGAFRVHIPENVTTIAPGVFKGMDVLTVDGHPCEPSWMRLLLSVIILQPFVLNK